MVPLLPTVAALLLAIAALLLAIAALLLASLLLAIAALLPTVAALLLAIAALLLASLLLAFPLLPLLLAVARAHPRAWLFPLALLLAIALLPTVALLLAVPLLRRGGCAVAALRLLLVSSPLPTTRTQLRLLAKHSVGAPNAKGNHVAVAHRLECLGSAGRRRHAGRCGGGLPIATCGGDPIGSAPS